MLLIILILSLNLSPRPDLSTLNVPPSLGDAPLQCLIKMRLECSIDRISALVVPVAQTLVVQWRVHDMSRDKTQQSVMPAKAARQEDKIQRQRQRQTTAPQVTCTLHTDVQAEYPPSPTSSIVQFISADLLIPCLIPHLARSIDHHPSNNRRASWYIYLSYPVPVGGLVCPLVPGHDDSAQYIQHPYPEYGEPHQATAGSYLIADPPAQSTAHNQRQSERGSQARRRDRSAIEPTNPGCLRPLTTRCCTLKHNCGSPQAALLTLLRLPRLLSLIYRCGHPLTARPPSSNAATGVQGPIQACQLRPPCPLP